MAEKYQPSSLGDTQPTRALLLIRKVTKVQQMLVSVGSDLKQVRGGGKLPYRDDVR